MRLQARHVDTHGPGPAPQQAARLGLDQQLSTGGFGERKSIVADMDNQVLGMPKEALSPAAL